MISKEDLAKRVRDQDIELTKSLEAIIDGQLEAIIDAQLNKGGVHGMSLVSFDSQETRELIVESYEAGGWKVKFHFDEAREVWELTLQ